jgi:asparagine synthase (glutamine-hydrolysing)
VSGFAAIVNFDGRPVDRSLLDRMARYLAFRGPDEQRIWVGGLNQNVGLVHAKFATTFESEREHQPVTVDGNSWISGHIRVDARDELRHRLAGGGRRDLDRATDAELLLHAYAASGMGCVDYLLGDFGFALWDEANRLLWCATDHMGIRPVFYERQRHTLVVSNTLDCVRLHPESDSRLNELAIADFLVHEFNLDPTSTVYDRIGRVGPGCSVSFRKDETTARTYWELPAEDPVLGRKPDDVIGEFRHLLEKAVSDRIRTRRIAIYLSGGIDSPTLAATAVRMLPHGHRDLTGYCLGFRHLIPDDEFRFAGLVAEKLGVEIRYRDLDESCFDPLWHARPASPPEPSTYAWSYEGNRALRAEIEGSARVVFYGEGPDNALRYDWEGYLGHLLGRRKWVAAAAGLRDHVGADRPVSAASAGVAWLSRRVRRPQADASPRPQLPAWLNRDLATRLGLEERCHALRNPGVEHTHPWRLQTYAMLKRNLWRRLFDSLDPAMFGVAEEVRHPYLDARLLRFFLTLPVIPWCRDKALLRRAMSEELPAQVLSRPKTTSKADPTLARVKSLEYTYPAPRALAALAPFIEPARLPAGSAGQTDDCYEHLRVFALDHWLACRDDSRGGVTGNWTSADSREAV